MTMPQEDLVAVRDLSDRLQWTEQKREASLARTWNKLNAISVAAAGRADGERATPRRLRRRWLVPAAAGLAVLAVAATVALNGFGFVRPYPPAIAPVDGEAMPVGQAWAELIEASAGVQPVNVEQGAYFYVKQTGAGYSSGGDRRLAQNQDRETWVRPGYLQVIRIVQHGDTLVDNDPNGIPGGEPGLYTPTEGWLHGLPTDPTALAGVLLEQTHRDSWSARHELWEQVGQLGSLGVDVVLPAELRSALYRVLADEENLTAQRLRFGGRTVIAIQRVERDSGQQLLFDETTGRLVGRRSVVVSAGAGQPAGEIASWSVWEVSVVGGVGARP